MRVWAQPRQRAGGSHHHMHRENGFIEAGFKEKPLMPRAPRSTPPLQRDTTPFLFKPVRHDRDLDEHYRQRPSESVEASNDGRQGYILARAQQFCASPSYFSESHHPDADTVLFIPTPLGLPQSKTHILEGNRFPLLAFQAQEFDVKV